MKLFKGKNTRGVVKIKLQKKSGKKLLGFLQTDDSIQKTFKESEAGECKKKEEESYS